MIFSYLVLAHQVLAHVALILLFIFFPVKYWLVTFATYAVIYCFGGTITYHRLLSHSSFKPKTWFFYVGSLLGMLSCAGSPIAWAATHRKHHRYVDQSKDPHSMRFMPWYRVQWLSMLVPAEAKFATHLLRSRFQVFLHRNYFFIHVGYALILTTIDYRLLIYFYLAPAALVWEAGSVINTVCHKWGYKNYELEDDSKNNRLISWLTFGEGLHNNHHAKQGNYNFSRKPGELDIGGFFIKRLSQKT